MSLKEGVLLVVLMCSFTGTLAQREIFMRQNPPIDDSRSCTLDRTSIRGTCQSIYECPIILRNIKKLRPTICYMQGRIPFVCCPTRKYTLNNVSPPSINFACGKSSVKPVTRRNVEDLVTKFLAAPDSSASFHQIHSPDSGRKKREGDKEVYRGVLSNANTWPWMALLGYRATPDPTWVCDGVLINRQWVLTAAHCVIAKFVDIVRLGEHDLKETTESVHQDFGVIQTVFNPEYNYPEGYHDLALLKLDRPVSFITSVKPICLPWGRNPVPTSGSILSLAGWGRSSFGGNRSNELQEATLYILDSQKCADSYSTLLDYAYKYPRGITSDLLCIGDTDGEGQDACQGDSGGPVMYLKDGRYFVTGIVSRGYGCGNQEFPGLYASVHYAPDLAWIKSVAF